MREIITGFKTIEDVEKTLEWMEDNTDFYWFSGCTPTKGTQQKEDFEEYQKNKGGLYIAYGNNFMYGSIDCLKRKEEEYKETNFRDLIGEEERNPKEGDEVLVRDSGESSWEKRIFIFKLPEKVDLDYRVFVVEEEDEKRYRNGEKYMVDAYQQMKKIEEKKKITLELTDEQLEKIKEVIS